MSLTRCGAELRRVVDGDTYVLLVDVRQQHFDEGAVTMRVRLGDFSCPEVRRGTPVQRAAGRAAALAAEALLRSGPLEVELLARPMSLGRQPAWLWAGGVPVGPELERQGHARPGARMG